MRRIRLNPDDRQLERAGLAALASSDWDGLIALVRSHPAETAYIALRLLGNVAPLGVDLRPLIARGGLFDFTIAGALLTMRATRFRGLGMAEDVTEEQWELYIPTLAHAQELLAEANRMEPSLGLTAAWRVAAYVDADDEDKDEAELALRQAVDVPVSGFSRLLTLRTEKWGGSHEQMWRVARGYADRDPPGTLGLIAKAHFEQWLYLANFDENPEAAARVETYFGEPEVLGELEEASARVLAAEVPRDPRALLYADNCFALAFWVAGLPRQARPHLQRMGRHQDRSLWLFGNPRLELVRARLSAWLPPF
jgi:hypothetical protein